MNFNWIHIMICVLRSEMACIVLPTVTTHQILITSIFVNTLSRDKMADISQTTFWNAFSWMKICKFRLRFHWRLFLRVQLTIFQHWFRKWLGAYQATSHYLNQWWLVYRRIYASISLNELRYIKSSCNCTSIMYTVTDRYRVNCQSSCYCSLLTIGVILIIFVKCSTSYGMNFIVFCYS